MPTYEYECQSCGGHTEKFQKMSDAPLLVCPHCKESQLTQQLSAPAFQLKGTGWYVTDFKDKKTEPSTLSPSSTDSKPAVTDTKNTLPETKTTNSTTEASK
jgi:putative FmdB family regulatory protein